MKTRITELFGIEYPIIQGAMQWLSKAELCAAVSEAGGLGTINCPSYADGAELAVDIKKVKSMTDKPFCVNISMLPDTKIDDKLMSFINAIIDGGVKIVETAGRSPYDLLPILKDAGIICFHKCTEVRFALKAQELGVDAVCIVGQEGGGHPGQRDVGSIILWPKAAEELEIPVIAAGGVCDGKTMYAALAMGAEAVTVGTRFMIAKEAPLHDNIRKLVIDASENDTIRTQMSIKNALRGINNEAARYIIKREEEGISFPDLYELIRGTNTLAAFKSGDVNQAQMAMGQVIGRIHESNTVKEIIDGMVSECNETALRMNNILGR